MKISVITPTARPSGLRIVAKALSEQTFRDFEWIVSAPKDVKLTQSLDLDCFYIYPQNRGKLSVLRDPPKPEGAFWTLNRAYNQMIRKAKGDLIVSWQDFTYATPEALSKFWYYFTHDYGHALISGTGHKYADDTWKEAIWEDPRKRSDQDTFYTCIWTDVEWNFCSCPKKALYAIGGFDEEMDMLGFGMDGYGVNERIHDLGGFEFALDQTNESFSLEHGRLKGWDKNNLLGEGYTRRAAELKERNKWPVLDYLK